MRSTRTGGRPCVALVLTLVLSACALSPGALAQDAENETASNVTPAEPADEADATNVTPSEQQDLELPTDREQMGDAPASGVEDAPQESIADSAWFTVLAVLATIALGLLALMGVAYAAYRRGGDRR